MRLWVWRNFGIEVPEDWEMLQFSKKADAGNVAFADRYRFRLEFSWRALPTAPDLERMMSDYCAKFKLEDPDGVASRIKVAGWPGILSGTGGAGLKSRFARFFRSESCLTEVNFTWPEARDKKLERTVLGGVRVVGERPGGARRWKAFGMDVLASKGMRLQDVNVAPALAVMTFSGEKGTAREERFERRGMTSEWLRRPVGEWLRTRYPEGFDQLSRETRDLPGHTVETVRGTFSVTGLGRLIGRRRRHEAAAWVCPGDGRLYYVQTRSPETQARDGEGGLVVGGLSCCPDVPHARDRSAPGGASQPPPRTRGRGEAGETPGGRSGSNESNAGRRRPGAAGPDVPGSLRPAPPVPDCMPADEGPDGSWKRMLRTRPVQNTAADVKQEGEKGVRITVKKIKPFFLIPPLSWIIRPRLTGSVLLDGLGSQVWDMCTGERTVEDIVDEFARRHRLTFHESRVAVTNYMKLLVERGALAMAMTQAGA